MSEPIGNLCLVLHGHMPYVLNHGDYPHGEAWLYEAAAETHLPILDMIGEVALLQKRPAITIGMMPVLLEQLAHDRFKTGFVKYLHGRIDKAKQDRKEFEADGDQHSAYLASRWEEWFGDRLAQFERIGRDIPGEFAKRYAEGHIELLTSNATHAYMPLVLNDQMLAAQMKCGVATSEKHLGKKPSGMWLPECAYRPHWPHWMPSVLFDNARDRSGVETFMEQQGITHFFVESHLVQNATPMGHRHDGNFYLGAGGRAGGNDTLEPVGVASEPRDASVHAFARHPKVSEQVWSGSIGYPANGKYLEFHRKRGERGLRYHKITSTKTPLSAKDPYYPDDIPSLIHEHASHFCDTVRSTLWDYNRFTGRRGTVVASFDAELFGHWWFEGPRFLRDVILNLAGDEHVRLSTASEVLERDPADKVMRLPEGSWGENGDHTVWANDSVKWWWEIEYRAEGEFLKQLHSLPWKTNADVRVLLEKAGRQLLLLQASDWAFVIHTQGAVDYGIQRIADHATNFGRLIDAAGHVATGGELSDVQKVEIANADAHDVIFQDIDLNWWM
ncbi:MAG: 1,4-alpha-glucan branching protein domain-containing protein [Planctomycetota bacterium]